MLSRVSDVASKIGEPGPAAESCLGRRAAGGVGAGVASPVGGPVLSCPLLDFCPVLFFRSFCAVFSGTDFFLGVGVGVEGLAPRTFVGFGFEVLRFEGGCGLALGVC